MKKAKIISILVVILSAVIVLASCGVSPEKVYNMNYRTESNYVKEAKALTDFNGYRFIGSNGTVAQFENTVSEFEETVIYNQKTGNTVATYTDKSGLDYSVSLNYSEYAYVVTIENVYEQNVEVYDNLGTRLYRGHEMPAAPTHKNAPDDFVVFDETIYRVLDNGGLEKIAKINSYSKDVFDKIDYVCDKYCFDLDSGVIKVYDTELSLLNSYSAPTYAENALFFILNNENAVMQYMVGLPADAQKYDIYENGTKYDLVTKIIDIGNRSEKEVDVDYVIGSVLSKKTIDVYFEQNSPMVEKYENIATVYRIKDKLVDRSDTTVDFVLMDNELKLGESGKLVSDQAMFGIEKLMDNRYAVTTLNGYTVIDAKGNFIKSFPANMKNLGGILWCNSVVYNANLEKLKDFSLYNNLSILQETEDAMIISVDSGNRVYLISDGKITNIWSYSAEMDKERDFNATEFGYSIYSYEKEVFEHYNFKGEKLLETKEQLYYVADFIYYTLSNTSIKSVKYYLFAEE